MEFMTSMASIFNYSIDLKESELAAQMTFDVISNNKDHITSDDLYKLRQEQPELLKWLHKPEQFLKERTTHKPHITYHEFQQFYQTISTEMQNMQEELTGIKNVFGRNTAQSLISNELFKKMSSSKFVDNGQEEEKQRMIETEKVQNKLHQMSMKMEHAYNEVITFGQANQQYSNTSTAEIGGGGNFVQMRTLDFDLVLNVLLGIRRSLGDLSNALPKITDRNYSQQITVKTDWVSSFGKYSS